MKDRLIELIPFIVFMSLLLYVVNDLYVYMGFSRSTGAIIFGLFFLVQYIMYRINKEYE